VVEVVVLDCLALAQMGLIQMAPELLAVEAVQAVQMDKMA